MTSVLKRILIVAAVFVALVVGVQILASSMVPAEQAQEQLKQGLAKAGFTLEGETVPSISLRAGIRLTFPNVVIQGEQEQLKPLRIQAQEMVVMLPLSSIWGEFALQEVQLQQAAISYDSYKASAVATGADQAEPSPARLLGLLSTIDPLPYDVHLIDSTLRVNDVAGASGEPQGTHLFIDLVSQTSGWTLSGKGEMRGKPTELAISNMPGADNGRDVKLSLRNDVVSIDYNGSRSTSVPPLLQGKVVFQAADTTAVRQLLTGEIAEEEKAATPAGQAPEETKENDPLQSIAPAKTSAKEAPALTQVATANELAALAPAAGGAVRFSSDIYYRQGQVVVKNIDLALPSLELKGEAGGMMQAPYNVQANLQFAALDTNALTDLGGLTHSNWLPGVISSGSDAKANARILIKADKVTGLVQGTQLNGLLELADGTAKISQFSMEAPGNTALGFEGSFAVTPQGPTLIGKFSGQGEQFHQFLPAISEMPLTLPKESFRDFAIAGDIRISPEDIRLSDTRAKIGATVLSVAYIHQLATKDTGIRLSVSNLDADALLASDAAAGMQFLKRGQKGGRAQLLPTYINDLLLGLRSNYNIYLYADNYIYDGSPRDPLELRMRANRGRVELDQFATRVNGADVSFTGFADINTSVPKFKLDMSLGDLDMDRFQRWLTGDEKPSATEENAPSPESPQGTRWSNAALNWDFIPLADGEISLKAVRVLHHLGMLTNAKLLFKLNNEQITMEESTANLFNADLRMRGQLTGGALPTWQTSFSVANLEVAELRRLFPWMQSVQGRISISGVLASNGASQLAHVRNLKGNMAVAGRAIQINEFDLAGAVNVLRQMASVDNLKNTLDVTLPQSNTRFESLEGTVQINAGEVNIPRMVMRSNRFVGAISGEANIVDWTMSAKTVFPLSVLIERAPPEMVLQAKGTMDNITVTRDDRSLEQYVVQKTANELIQGK